MMLLENSLFILWVNSFKPLAPYLNIHHALHIPYPGIMTSLFAIRGELLHFSLTHLHLCPHTLPPSYYSGGSGIASKANPSICPLDPISFPTFSLAASISDVPLHLSHQHTNMPL